MTEHEKTNLWVDLHNIFNTPNLLSKEYKETVLSHLTLWGESQMIMMLTRKPGADIIQRHDLSK